jgi:hypothetical protein
MLDFTTLKAYHFLSSAALASTLATVSADVPDLPDLRAFLIYACYGSLGATALTIWSTRFRTPLKFAGIMFTGAVVAGLVGVAAADLVGVAVAPLLAFIAALMGPAFVLDPIGTLKRVLLAWREYTGPTNPAPPDPPNWSPPPSGPHDDDSYTP